MLSKGRAGGAVGVEEEVDMVVVEKNLKPKEQQRFDKYNKIKKV